MHPNEKLLRDSDEAADRGDIEGFLAPFSEDVVVHIGGRSKLAGDLHGKEQLGQRFQVFLESLGEDPELETHDILANDEHGVMLQIYRGTKGGNRVEVRGIGIVHFRDGKISEAWFIDEDPYTADPFYDA
jgi:ketosteroid isomerase-like protein